MLFTDADVVSAADLLLLDPEAANVLSDVDQFDSPVLLEGTNSICEIATSEAASVILAANQTFGSAYSLPGISAAHLAAVMNTGLKSGTTTPRCKMSQVVVHEAEHGVGWSPIKRWVAHLALMILYRTVVARRTEDRYAVKMDLNADFARARWFDLVRLGIPVVDIPFPCPGAKAWLDSGAFTSANVTTVASVGAVGGSKRVAICWVDETHYDATLANRGDAESGPSAIIPITVASGQAISISISTLNPPTGAAATSGTAQGIVPSVAATGWNVFVGGATGPLYLQNSSPIPVATLSYTLAGDPQLGKIMRNGQNPLYNLTFLPDQISRM